MTALVRREEDSLTIVLHGHPSSRPIELIRKADQELRDENVVSGEDNRVRVCITATHGNVHPHMIEVNSILTG